MLRLGIGGLLGRRSHQLSNLAAVLNPKPVRPGVFSEKSFSEYPVEKKLVENLEINAKISMMTQVQAKSFDPISSGKDVTVCSETGSGKTMAYLVPLMDRLVKQKELNTTTGTIDLLGRASPPVVILCPSSDLCRQVLEVMRTLDPENQLSKQWLIDQDGDLKCEGIVIGQRIRWGAVDLVVATPGKLCQDLERFRQDKLYPSTVVFDEADFLFHGSTGEEIRTILSYTRPKIHSVLKSENSFYPPVQCVFVSATLPDIGKRTIAPMLVNRFMTSEVVEVGNFHALPSSIDTVEFIPELNGNWEERCYLLTDLLGKHMDKRSLVFLNSQRNASVLNQFLLEKKWPVTLFKKGKSYNSSFSDERIVITTDAGARGIDWNGGVDLVVNFQMPTDVVAWIHRAGRCGRIGKPGSVVSFFKQQDEPLVEALKQKLAEREKLDTLFSRKRSFRRTRRSNYSIVS
jgi:superfamily II DNA/RNA helicase